MLSTAKPSEYVALRDTQSGARRPQTPPDVSLKRKRSWCPDLLYGGLAIRVVTRTTK